MKRKLEKDRKPSAGLFALVPLAMVVLTACGSLGGIFDRSGDDRDARADVSGSDVSGSIVEVDTWSRQIVVDTDDTDRLGRSLRNQDGERTIEYDARTVVEYQGEEYQPEDLEPGDQVDVRLSESDRNVADRIFVIRDVSSGVAADGDDELSNVVTGTVADVDLDDRLIEIEPSDRNRRLEVVAYDERTVVLFEGREYQPENLERGDEVRVTGTTRAGRLLADRITVEQDVRAGDTTSDEDRIEDVRGTVLDVDSRAHLIELDLPFGARGDERVYYDERTVVELDGRRLDPESLREGDEISVRGSRRGDRFMADRIVVLQDSRGPSAD
jgi:hypothetical protein